MDPLDNLLAYRRATLDERCKAIVEYYAGLKAQRVARYDRRHGPGSSARDFEAIRATPVSTAPLSNGAYDLGDERKVRLG